MSEKKLEECSLQDATHVELGGKVHRIGEGIVERLFANKYWQIKVMGFEIHEYIIESSFPIFGIKPMKEKENEKKPIEFEARFVKTNGNWHPMYNLDDGFLYPNCKMAMFKCVEIVEEEK